MRKIIVSEGVALDGVFDAQTMGKWAARQKHLIGGSAMLVQTLLQADLIDEINLIVHPVVAGSGKRLFNGRTANTKLMKLVENKTLSQGVVALTYELAK